jgi:hypothetical protein
VSFQFFLLFLMAFSLQLWFNSRHRSYSCTFIKLAKFVF